MNQEIGKPAQYMINWYNNLNIGGKKITCPYYRNTLRVRAELRSLVGKGTPEEIETETLIFSKLRGFSLVNHSIQEIREFMRSQGIGVDCSGFVSQVYDFWLRMSKKGPLQNNIHYPPAGLYRRFARMLRPIEHTNVYVLTLPENADKIDYNDCMPGDMIKMHGLKHGLHIAMIFRTNRDDNNKLRKIWYVESSPYYSEGNGLRTGVIEMSSNSKK